MLERPDISVLMPTYNHSNYIPTAIQSVLNQSYKNWELIIIDDGSTDNTPKAVKQFADDRIVYLRQEKNSGQLNALMKGAKCIRGKYITLLHSDDEFLDDKALERNISSLRNYNCDGIFSDLLEMDQGGEIYGVAKTTNSVDLFSAAILFLRGGSNITSDIFFVKNGVFSNVLSNYILWNMPYWLKFNRGHINVLKLKKVEPWYKYRVYSENYIRSDAGKFEALNGSLRAVIEIGKIIDLPLLKIQRLLVKAFKIRIKPLFRLNSCSPHHLREMATYVIQRYYKKIPENLYFKGLLGFYSNFPSNRTVKLRFKEEDEIFLGKDARIFFYLLEKRSLPTVYEYILEQAVNGLGKVVVKDKESYEKALNLTRFLDLFTKIEIE